MRLKKGFALHDVCGEKVLIAEGIENVNFSKMINLNPSAALLWSAAEKGEFTPESLADVLVQEYEVDAVQALCDTTVLVEQWKEHGLIDG